MATQTAATNPRFMLKVDADPRVKAAKQALDTFRASETKEGTTTEELNLLERAHLENYTLTRNAVRMEFLQNG